MNNLYGWTISLKLPLGAFKWVENTPQSSKDFIENYNGDSDEGYFLEADVQYPEKLYDLQNDLPFLTERMRIEKVEKLTANLQDKKECYTHRKLKTNIKSWISTEKTALSH